MITCFIPTAVTNRVMRVWLLASDFSNDLSAVLARFTDAKYSEDGPALLPSPQEGEQVSSNLFASIVVLAFT